MLRFGCFGEGEAFGCFGDGDGLLLFEGCFAAGGGGRSALLLCSVAALLRGVAALLRGAAALLRGEPFALLPSAAGFAAAFLFAAAFAASRCFYPAWYASIAAL